MSLASEFGELLGRQLTDEELAGVHDKLAVVLRRRFRVAIHQDIT